MSDKLCLSAVIHELKTATRIGQKKLLHDLFELIDNEYIVNDRLANRIMKNKENIRKDTQKLANAISEDDFAKGVRQILSNHLPHELKLDLVHNITGLINRDTTIAPNKKASLLCSAENEDVYKFVAVVILYVIQRKNIFVNGNKPVAVSSGYKENATPPHNLPKREQCFIGRKDKLELIHQNFASKHPGCVKQTIFGLGGFGKTEVALAYARKHLSEYKNGIGYINAESSQSIKASLLEFAKAVCKVAKTLTDENLYNVVKDWLCRNDSWLLILDNVDDVEDDMGKDAYGLILSFISDLPTGHVLLTTRNSELMIGEPIYVEVFTPEEALDFMINRLEKRQDLSLYNTDCYTELAELTWRLGYMPLALEQAVAFMINSGGTSCREYHALLDEHGIALFDEKYSTPREYERTLTATLELSFDRLSTGTKHFLCICAYMAPERISLAFFQKHWTKFSDPLTEVLGQDMGIIEIVSELVKFCLVKREDGFISIHRMVQEVICKKSEKTGETTKWLKYLLNAVDEEVPGFHEFVNPDRLEQFRSIVVHAASLLTHIRKFVKAKFETREYVKVVNLFQQELMIYMKILGLKQSPFVTGAIDIYIRIAGSGFVKRHNLMNTTRRAAITHYKNGNLAEALECFMDDLLHQVDISTLYPNMVDALEKLSFAYNVCQNLISSSPYPAAIKLMMGYLEDEIGSPVPNSGKCYPPATGG